MNENTALLVMVHGSPRPESNRDMFKVVERIRARELFRFVTVGFMELNEPTIPEAIAQCVDSGASKVIAVPYFLHAGTHVADDLPGLLEDAAQQFPGVEFLMGDYLGRDQNITNVVRDRVQSIAAAA
jgi:sirohydrochlorin ferrochelatase